MWCGLAARGAAWCDVGGRRAAAGVHGRASGMRMCDSASGSARRAGVRTYFINYYYRILFSTSFTDDATCFISGYDNENAENNRHEIYKMRCSGLAGSGGVYSVSPSVMPFCSVPPPQSHILPFPGWYGTLGRWDGGTRRRKRRRRRRKEREREKGCLLYTSDAADE